jgi:hypothetical protein
MDAVSTSYIMTLLGPGERGLLVSSYSRRELDQRSLSLADASHGHGR